MKKIFFLLALMPALLRAQTGQGFTINGNIAGLENGTVTIASAEDKHVVASGTAAGGTFVLNGSVPEPGMYLLVLPKTDPQVLFLDNSQISITGDRRDIANISVSGSPTHSDYTEFNRIFKPLVAELNVMANTIQKEADEKKREVLIGQWNTLVGRVDSEVTKYIAAHPSSIVSAFLLFNFSTISPDINLLEQRFNALDASVRHSRLGQSLGEKIAMAKVGAVGTEAIDFTQNDVNGKPVTLSSFKGKYVLLDFWASWCRPCRAENPNVVKVYNKFKDKNFTIVGVSLDQEKAAWVRAIQNDHLTWNHVSDLQQWHNAVAQLYHIESIPGNFLIDPNGKIIARDLRGEELDKKLCEILGCR